MTQPLKGLKVLDFSTLLPGPYATQLLADMGAEVLRVESPTRPDLLKVMPPYVGKGKAKVSAAHATINRNKKSIAIDLKHESAKAIVERLLSEYDIVVEQFRPGVMARLGLDYDALKQKQGKLIYCSITGYGQSGPYRDRAGHDINYLALSGLASYAGRRDTGPILSSTQIADIAGGSHHAVMAILAAVIERQVSGEGQYLDISMSDAALALSTMYGAGTLASGTAPQCGSEMLNGGLFYDYYETSDGRYLSIGSLEPNFASGLLSALDLQDRLPQTADTRLEIQDGLRAAIAEKISQNPLDHWVNVFSAIDVCVEPVLNLDEAMSHPHFQARGMVANARNSEGEEIPQLQSALPFQRAQHQAGATLGADTDLVLEDVGFSQNQIEELRSSKCIK